MTLTRIAFILICFSYTQFTMAAEKNNDWNVYRYSPPPTTFSTIYETACVSYTSPSGNYIWSLSGTYSDTIPNVTGGDSIMTIVLTINMPDVTFIQHTSCSSYSWPMSGLTYSNSGNYASTTQNMHGCDSTIVLELTVATPSFDTSVVTECDSYLWPANGVTYTSSGVYTEVYSGLYGCDSSLTLDLTILNATSASVFEVACNSYVWGLNGNSYSSSGTYTETIPNAQGCDSTVTLNLVILNSSTFVEYETVCDQYTWPQNGQTYVISGQYGDTLTNSLGCDSIVVLDLTVNHGSNNIDFIESCGPYTWIDGVTYTSSTSGPNVLLSSIHGCDSTVQLDLFIGESYDLIDSVEACSQYTWINGITYYQSTNTPQWLYLTSIGCDSLITLHLDITQSTLWVDSIAVCDSLTWIDGNTYTESNYQATHTITNSQGCDSIILLNLTILNPSSDVSIVGNSLVSSATNAIDYQWLDCQNNMAPIPNADSYIFAPGDNGYYAVEVTNANCTSVSDCISVSELDVPTQTKNALAVYPVPTHDLLYVETETNIDKFEVYDMLGRRLPVGANCNEGILNVSNLVKGRYFLHIFFGDQSFVIRDFVVN